MTALIFISTLLAIALSDKCEYPSSSDTSRAFDRLAQDQETDLIPKICFNEDECGNDVCARDPEILSDTVGCIWCDNKNSNSCDEDPSDDTESDDFYQCFETTPESCGCVDDRDADVAVLIDVTQQTVESFNYYLLYFTYWFSENLLPETDNTNLRFILYTDEVVYSGKEPYKEYDFDFDDDEGIPLPMDDLPNDIDGADDVDFCPALEEALDFFDNDGKYDTQLLYWIPYQSHGRSAFSDCDDDGDKLDGIKTFALRFWDDTDLERFETVFGDLDWCEYFQKGTYTTSQGNSADTRYFVNTFSDFICAEGGGFTDEPTNDHQIASNVLGHQRILLQRTDDPTEDPTSNPSEVPTVDPTNYPTQDPLEETDEPSVDPTSDPTNDPTSDPVEETDDPTVDPTVDPTDDPTAVPSSQPSEYPTSDPSEYPTEDPTEYPTEHPTDNPTTYPSEDPTENPTDEPSYTPSYVPTDEPTEDSDSSSEDKKKGKVWWAHHNEHAMYRPPPNQYQMGKRYPVPPGDYRGQPNPTWNRNSKNKMMKPWNQPPKTTWAPQPPYAQINQFNNQRPNWWVEGRKNKNKNKNKDNYADHDDDDSAIWFTDKDSIDYDRDDDASWFDGLWKTEKWKRNMDKQWKSHWRSYYEAKCSLDDGDDSQWWNEGKKHDKWSTSRSKSSSSSSSASKSDSQWSKDSDSSSDKSWKKTESDSSDSGKTKWWKQSQTDSSSSDGKQWASKDAQKEKWWKAHQSSSTKKDNDKDDAMKWRMPMKKEEKWWTHHDKSADATDAWSKQVKPEWWKDDKSSSSDSDAKTMWAKKDGSSDDSSSN